MSTEVSSDSTAKRERVRPPPPPPPPPAPSSSGTRERAPAAQFDGTAETSANAPRAEPPMPSAASPGSGSDVDAVRSSSLYAPDASASRERAPAAAAPTPAQPQGSLDERMRAAGVPDAQRRRVNERLARLSPQEREREERIVKHALGSNNAQRALTTWERTHQMAQQSPRARERLTPDVREALVRGVADRQSTSANGQQGVMGPRQAEDAARALVAMPQAQYDQVRSAMERAGQAPDGQPRKGADPHAERALLLKAVGARRAELSTSPERAARALGEVTRFADAIRGMERSELMRSTTLRDVDGNGGGHRQTWADSCGPTTAQMVRGERDPVYALQVRQQGTGDGTPAAQQQREVLERPRFFDRNDRPMRVTPEQEARYLRDGTMPRGAARVERGGAVSRQGEEAQQRLDDRLDSPWGLQKLSDRESEALRRYSRNERLTPEQQRDADAALEKVRAADGGRPTDADLRAMRSNWRQNPDGTSTRRQGDGMRLEPALNDVAPSDRLWQPTDTNGGRPPGMNDRDLDRMDQRLNNGQPVPIRIANRSNDGDGHFMMVSDVRGQRPNRQYLVNDPWTGRSSWVPERELRNPRSNWPQRRLQLAPNSAVTTTYAD